MDRTTFSLLCIAVVSWITPADAKPPNVRFDTLPAVACRDVTDDEFAAVNPGERLLEAKFEISSMLDSGSEADLTEFFFRMTSPQQSFRIADYSPRTKLASDYNGGITIEKKQEDSKGLGLAVTGGWYAPNVTGHGDASRKQTLTTKYELVAPMESVTASGTIQPKRSVDISAETMGKVVDLTVVEGQTVTAGQHLLQIDPRNLETQVQNREASLASARSQLEQTRAQIENSKVALQQSRDTLRRQEELWKAGLIPRDQYERSVNDLAMRETDLRVMEQSMLTQMERLLGLLNGKPFLPVFVHAQEVTAAGWDMIEKCAPAILGPFDLGDPAYLLKAPGILDCRGVLVAFGSAGTRQDLLTAAVLSMKHGLSFQGALSALTANPARIFRLEKRLGKIAPGFDADLVLWSGNPFTLNARVESVWIEGKKVYQAPVPASLPALPPKEAQ